MKKECPPSDTINEQNDFSHRVYCLYHSESQRIFELEETLGHIPLSYSASCYHICPVCLPCLPSHITSFSKAGPISFASWYLSLFIVGTHKLCTMYWRNTAIKNSGNSQALESGIPVLKSQLHQELHFVGKADIMSLSLRCLFQKMGR